MMYCQTNTESNIENIRQYLSDNYSGKNINGAKQCALVSGKELCFGLLIRIEDKEKDHLVLPLNKFLYETSVDEMPEILRKNDLTGLMERAGGRVVRLKSDGFDIWEPLLSKHSH